MNSLEEDGGEGTGTGGCGAGGHGSWEGAFGVAGVSGEPSYCPGFSCVERKGERVFFYFHKSQFLLGMCVTNTCVCSDTAPNPPRDKSWVS